MKPFKIMLFPFQLSLVISCRFPLKNFLLRFLRKHILPSISYTRYSTGGNAITLIIYLKKLNNYKIPWLIQLRQINVRYKLLFKRLNIRAISDSVRSKKHYRLLFKLKSYLRFRKPNNVKLVCLSFKIIGVSMQCDCVWEREREIEK